MREISFRGLRIDTRQVVYGYLSIDNISDNYYIEPFDEGKPVRVIKKSIGQFTGKWDVDGIKIYEGNLKDLSGLEIFTKIPNC